MDLGDYLLELSAYDGEYTATAQVHVTVTPSSGGPTGPYVSGDGFGVSIVGPTVADLQTGVVLTGVATDAAGSPVPAATFAWTQTSGPTATYGASGVTSAITFPSADTFGFQLAVTAGAVTRTATWTVHVVLNNHAPTVTVGADQTVSSAGATLTGGATDDGYPKPTTLTTSWSQIAGPGTAKIATPTAVQTAVTLTQPGTYAFRLTAFDGELTAFADTHVILTAPAGGAPVVTLSGLADDALVTKPVTVTGTVSEGAWALQYRLGGRDDVDTAWTNVATGTGAKSGTLGTFDPTMLENGIYTVRLVSNTSAGQGEVDLSVAVDGNMKIGLFSLSYVDLEVQLGRMPLQILRTYDNRRHGRPGDFGANGELSTRAVRVEKAGKTGAAWLHTVDTSGFAPVYCLTPQRSSRVTVTLPGGRQYRFHPTAQCEKYNPVTAPEVSWVCDSHPGNPTVALTAEGASGLIALGPAPGPTMLQTAGGDPWNPRIFNLTTEDGTYDASGRQTGRFEKRSVAQYGQNQPPVARFGGNFTSPTTLDVNGFGTSDDGLPPGGAYTVVWSVASGPAGATFSANNSPGVLTLATFTTPGTYVLRMSVSDSQLVGIAEATLVIPGTGTVLSVRPPPTAGPDTLGSTTEYDANGRAIKQIAPDGSVTEATYDESGNVIARKDALGRITTMTYDATGRNTKTVAPDGTFRAQSYDAEGRRVTSTDENGHTTVTTYDVTGNAVKTTFADGSSTATVFDLAKQMTSMTDERGNTTTFIYDLAGRRTSVTNALGQTSSTAYDAAGRSTSQTDPLGHTTSTTYDDAGRVVATKLADGTSTTYAYDAKGQKLAETDALSRISEWAYDADGRLAESHDQAGQVWAFGYDGIGNMLTQTDALGRVTRFAFDERNRQVARTLPLGMTEHMVYDVASQKTAKTDFNGYTTTYDYDARGRLVAKLPDPARGEAPVAMVYTATGRKAQTSNGAGVVRYGYDVRERLVKKEMPAGTLAYTYDPHGNVATMKSSNVGGVDVKYGWDAANRLASVTDPAGVSTMEYDAAGRLTKRTDPNGVVMTYSYDNVNRVLDVAANRGATPIADYGYTRDTIGRVTTLAELGGRTVTYGYSQAGRLVNETIATDPHGVNGSIAYTHDSVGNRLTRTSSVGPVAGQTFAYDANDRITTETYDLNGNTLAAEGDSFGYDFEDRLVAINGSVGISYDADGNLISRTEGVVKVGYLVDEIGPSGWGQVVEEVVAGSVSKIFTYGTSVLRTSVAGTAKGYVSDGHTDVRSLTDSGGAVSDEYDYDAFGVGTRTSSAISNSVGYTGERAEAAGLTFLRARYSRRATGRFLSHDPQSGMKKKPASFHRYVYAGDNPVMTADPSGKDGIDFITEANPLGARAGLGGVVSAGLFDWYDNGIPEGRIAPMSDESPGAELFQATMDEAADAMRQYTWWGSGLGFYSKYGSGVNAFEFGGAFLWIKGVGIAFTRPIVGIPIPTQMTGINLSDVLERAHDRYPGAPIIGDYHTHPTDPNCEASWADGAANSQQAEKWKNDSKLNYVYTSYVTSAIANCLVTTNSRSIPVGYYP